MQETFIGDDFEKQVEEITSEIERLVDRNHHDGSVEYSEYREEESPLDLEVKITGAWADLIGVTALISQSDSWTACTFVQGGESNETYLGLTYHPDPEGMFCLRSY